MNIRHLLMLPLVASLLVVTAKAQAPAASPSPQAGSSSSSSQPPASDDSLGSYQLVTSAELGARGIAVDGNQNKYESDLNYRAGLRLFDSSFFLRRKNGTGGAFDELLVNTSGWGSDPTGYTRINIEKQSLFRFDANVRRSRYFNAVTDLANPLGQLVGQHTQNIIHHFGVYDVTFLPDNNKFRFNLGYSRDTRNGPGVSTVRFGGDEFAVGQNQETRSNDFRAGFNAKLLGFDLSFTEGARYFRDHSNYFVNLTNQGNNPTNNGRIDSLYRETPTSGRHFFTRFSVHRLFARRFDFTGRYVYLSSTSRYSFFEQVRGRLSNGNLAVPDTFTARGQATRPSSLGDVGVTWLATSKFRISNTFQFYNFRINGEEPLLDVLRQSTVAGAPLPTVTTVSLFARTTNYRRFMNTIEADYQFNTAYSVHAGYRYTDRHIELAQLDRTTTTVRANDIFDNHTNSAIFGLKARPIKAWTIYFDGEHGEADNVFTRLANNDYTNFRIRNRINPGGNLALNFSFVTRDNTNATEVINDPAVVPPGTAPDALDVRVKARNFSSSIDWTKGSNVSLSGGYTYFHITSIAGILLPVSGTRRLGESQYYSRDHFFFFNTFLRPHSRLTLYAGYRINKDNGQGDRVPPSNVILLDSYPMSFQSPEARITLRLNRRLDWNVGYEYYNYKEKFFPIQNYHAHLPYTSLRLYFGRGE